MKLIRGGFEPGFEQAPVHPEQSLGFSNGRRRSAPAIGSAKRIKDDIRQPLLKFFQEFTRSSRYHIEGWRGVVNGARFRDRHIDEIVDRIAHQCDGFANPHTGAPKSMGWNIRIDIPQMDFELSHSPIKCAIEQGGKMLSRPFLHDP